MNIPDKTINELSKMLRENPNEVRVNLPIGEGRHLKDGKMVKYVIFIGLQEIADPTS